ncbi:MAG: hypothetical protein AB7G25_04945 [Sphingomonadaceae bacterium]
MSYSIVVIDLFGLVLIVLGYHMAFRQATVQHWWALLHPNQKPPDLALSITDDDPAKYALRISGVMILAFGIAISLLFTLSHFSGSQS